MYLFMLFWCKFFTLHMPGGQEESLVCNVLQEYADRVFDSWTKFLGNTIVGRVVESGWARVAEVGGTEAVSGMLARMFPAY